MVRKEILKRNECHFGSLSFSQRDDREREEITLFLPFSGYTIYTIIYLIIINYLLFIINY